MINNYLDLIIKQRLKNPNHQKDYRLIYLPTKTINFNILEEYEKLVSYPNVIFSNVIYRSTPLYKNLKDNYYYEFVDIGAGYKTTFEDWKFFYVPLSESSFLINQGLLPFFNFYSIDSPTIQKQHPSFQILTPSIRLSDYFYNTPSSNNKHPLSSIFNFTGYSYLNKEGQMLYEYIDTYSYNDDSEITYYSSLRPIDFYNSSSIVNQYALEIDNSLLFLEGAPPSFLELYENTFLDLKFTGKTTTTNFSKVKKWYEYLNFKNGQPFNKIILPYMPTTLSLDFVRLQLNNTNIGFKYNNIFNKQYLSLNQVSSNNIINLS